MGKKEVRKQIKEFVKSYKESGEDPSRLLEIIKEEIENENDKT